MYDVEGKLLNVIKSMYFDSSACVRIKGGVSKQFKIDSGVKHGCIMSPWLFNLYMDGVMKKMKMGMGKRGVSEWRGGTRVHVDGVRLEYVSEFKYLKCVLDESGTDGAECSRKVASGRRVAGTIRSLVNARDLQLELETLFVQCFGRRRRDLE